MRLLIDGDACPDRQKVIELACQYHVDAFLFADYAHVIDDERIHVVSCDVGKDSVDQQIVAFVQPGDFVITQDYGLAGLCLMKDAMVLHVSGKRITENNMNNLLESRYLGYISRKNDKHIKGPKKRSKRESSFFLREVEKVLIDWTIAQNDICKNK